MGIRCPLRSRLRWGRPGKNNDGRGGLDRAPALQCGSRMTSFQYHHRNGEVRYLLTQGEHSTANYTNNRSENQSDSAGTLFTTISNSVADTHQPVEQRRRPQRPRLRALAAGSPKARPKLVSASYRLNYFKSTQRAPPSFLNSNAVGIL